MRIAVVPALARPPAEPTWSEWLLAKLARLDPNRLISPSYVARTFDTSGWRTFRESSVAGRARELSSQTRAQELFGEDSTLCQSGGGIQFYPLDDAVGTPLDSMDEKVQTKHRKRFAFTEELLGETTHYYLDDGLPVVAFATKITSEELARSVHAVWDGQPFFYLHLVCSDAPGAGLRGMHKMLDLARSEAVPTVAFSALPEVVFYYYSKLGANFFNRLTNETVPLPGWAAALATVKDTGARRVPKVDGKTLEPMSDRTTAGLRDDAEFAWLEARQAANAASSARASVERRQRKR